MMLNDKSSQTIDIVTLYVARKKKDKTSWLFYFCARLPLVRTYNVHALWWCYEVFMKYKGIVQIIHTSGTKVGLKASLMSNRGDSQNLQNIFGIFL